VAAALLAGCGGSQTPVGAPRAQEAFGKGAFQAASDKDYLYISDDGAYRIKVLTFPGGKPIRRFPGAGWLCTNPKSGNLYASYDGLTEYAPGGSSKMGEAQYPQGSALRGCAVDPTTGSVAVVGSEGYSKEAVVLVYRSIDKKPKVYADSNFYRFLFCGYDGQGNLFIDDASNVLFELPAGKTEITNITFSVGKHVFAGTVQFDGTHITAEDPFYYPTIFRLSVSGSQGTVVGVTRLGSPHPFRFEKYTWIDKNTVLGSWGGTPKRYALGYWYYPKGGGPPFRLLDKLHPDFIATGITSGE
jgi:hypothetical protein